MDLKRKLGLVSGTGANQSYELIRSTQVTAFFHHLKRRTSDQQPAVFFFLQPNSQMFLRVFLLSHVLQLSSVCIWRQIPWDYSVTEFGSQVLAWKVLANFTIFLASHIYELHTSFLLVWWSLFLLELWFCHEACSGPCVRHNQRKLWTHPEHPGFSIFLASRVIYW